MGAFAETIHSAHVIRNPLTRVAKAVKSIRATNRWAVTGTPIQNRLTDLASLLHFLQIHPFTDLKAFDQHIVKPWKAGHPIAITKLTGVFQCIALRRPKGVVNLPVRRDEIHHVIFEKDERDTYDAIKNSTLHKISEIIADPEDSAGKYLNVLQWINSLRFICNLGTIYRKHHIDNVRICSWTAATAQEAYQSLDTSGASICSQCSLDIGFDSLGNTQLRVSELNQPRLSRCLKLLCGECYQYRLASSLTTCSDNCRFQQTCISFEVAPSDNTRSQVELETNGASNAKASSSKISALINALKNSGEGDKRSENLHLICWVS